MSTVDTMYAPSLPIEIMKYGLRGDCGEVVALQAKTGLDAISN